MKWSIQFATGVDLIDRQHQMLFQLIEDYSMALNEGHGERVYDTWLATLGEYARAHFESEERCMYQYACPAADANRSAHTHFVETLSGFRRRFATLGFVRADAQALVDFLHDWIVMHVGRIDVMLKPCAEGL